MKHLVKLINSHIYFDLNKNNFRFIFNNSANTVQKIKRVKIISQMGITNN
jgi:hypothetical protein